MGVESSRCRATLNKLNRLQDAGGSLGVVPAATFTVPPAPWAFGEAQCGRKFGE